jgi:hypothetical protein
VVFDFSRFFLHSLNTCMEQQLSKLQAIRLQLQRYEQRHRLLFPELDRRQPSCKAAARAWLNTLLPTLDWGVTLTLKQHMQVAGSDGQLNKHARKRYVAINEYEAAKVARQFAWELNKYIFGASAMRRYSKSLGYLAAVERGNASGRLHLHIAIGAVPVFIEPMEFFKAVGTAASKNPWIDREIYCDHYCVMDNRACNYVTKTLGRNNVDALVLNMPLAG